MRVNGGQRPQFKRSNTNNGKRGLKVECWSTSKEGQELLFERGVRIKEDEDNSSKVGVRVKEDEGCSLNVGVCVKVGDE